MATSTKARPNTALRDALDARGSIMAAAHRLVTLAERRGTPLGEPANVLRHLRRLCNGETRTAGEPYLSLICEDTGRSARDLFGIDVAPTQSLLETFHVTSHKFVTTYLGAEGIEALAAVVDGTPVELDGVACVRASVEGHDLYLFAVGVAIFHIVEPREFAYVAELARWRSRTYADVLAWASQWLSRAVGRDVDAGYVFSVYWLDRARWDGDALTTAVRLLSIPKLVLCDSGGVRGNAEAVEERLLADGVVDHGGHIVDFGMAGMSVAAASWSAIAYHPLVPDRALPPSALVEAQLLTQSTWAYCDHLLGEVKVGREPQVADEYGRRYLRAMRLRATAPGAQESGQSLAMRRAVFATSQLDHQVTEVLGCL